MMKMLHANPEQRISAEQALEHRYFKLDFNNSDSEADLEETDTVDMNL